MLNLSDKKDRLKIAKYVSDNKSRLEYNAGIFQILEGNMKDLIDAKMLEDLGAESFKAAKTRKAPINVFRKIVDKLTRIYGEPVSRTIVDGEPQDQELLDWYVKVLQLNRRMDVCNSFFNAFLYSLIYILVSDKKPFIRTIPNHEFLVMNCHESVDPTSDDVIILIMPKVADDKGLERECYWVYTDLEFCMMDENGEVHTELMTAMEQDGINPYEMKPFVYTNASANLIMPALQTDNMDMALLIPLLLTDLNYAVKFQAFSVFVGIDIDDKNIKFSPNSILSFTSKPNADGEAKPHFDVIKPTVDIDSTLALASSQMSLWLTTKGIRPGAIGQIGPDKFASGVSKMIDESDTYESVKKQIGIFEATEEAFWQKIMELHTFWVNNGSIEETRKFTPGATVKVEFSKPEPMRSRRDLIDELNAEIDSGFTTMKNAIKKLFPNLDEERIDEHIAASKVDMIERNRIKAPVQNPALVPNEGAA